MSTVPADGLVSLWARPSAGTEMTIMGFWGISPESLNGIYILETCVVDNPTLWVKDSTVGVLAKKKQDNINILRPRQMAAIFQTTFSNAFSLMKIYEFRLRFHWSLYPKVRINNIPALVQIMAWRRPGDKPLSEPMVVNLLTHICVTRPQWVNCNTKERCKYKTGNILRIWRVLPIVFVFDFHE